MTASYVWMKLAMGLNGLFGECHAHYKIDWYTMGFFHGVQAYTVDPETRAAAEYCILMCLGQVNLEGEIVKP